MWIIKVKMDNKSTRFVNTIGCSIKLMLLESNATQYKTRARARTDAKDCSYPIKFMVGDKAKLSVVKYVVDS